MRDEVRSGMVSTILMTFSAFLKLGSATSDLADVQAGEVVESLKTTVTLLVSIHGFKR
jgi:hypothetical protein